jgi:hypothetical protein
VADHANHPRVSLNLDSDGQGGAISPDRNAKVETLGSSSARDLRGHHDDRKREFFKGETLRKDTPVVVIDEP